MALTYKDFKAKLRRTIWVAPGEPSNLIAAHNIFFNEAMVEIAKWCLLNRQNNTSVINACKTLVRCGLTVFDSPPTVEGPGVIRKIYTIANDEWCDFVFYEPATYQELQCWSQRFRCAFTNPENAGLPALQQGFKYVEAATDSTHGRARIGLWAENRKRIYIAPWIQSNEKVVVEWDGWKQDWQDDDIVDEVLWGSDVQAAIRTLVRWKHEDNFGCDLQKKRDLYAQFYGDNREKGELATLMYWDRQKREGDPVEDCTQPRLPTSEEVLDDGPPETAGATSFAIIGDFGGLGTPQDRVAAMVAGWNPEFVISTGDNWYNTEVTKEGLDLKVGRLYQQWIGEYSGIYGAGATKQNFYATIGNHDRDPVGRLDIELDYFGFAKLQDLSSSSEIRPFYTAVRGPIQIFVLDAGYDNSQVNQQTKYGVSASSAQAEWLRIALLLSTAKWKLVFLHQPPYTSYHTAATQPTLSGDGFLAYPALRWPFKQWGASAVLSGHIHNYERLEVDDLPYIVNGAGGRSLATFTGAPSEFSVVRYDGNFGAIRGIANCDTLQLEFINMEGVVQDTFVLGPTLSEAMQAAVNQGTGSVSLPTITQNITNVTNITNIVGSTTHLGAFTDPNGNVVGNVGDSYKSVPSLGGDGQEWTKVTGNGTNVGWE